MRRQSQKNNLTMENVRIQTIFMNINIMLILFDRGAQMRLSRNRREIMVALI